ncbi:MAG: hypothetical protein BWY76_01751 [bacterium ADurb.Bin429]|nr:MAG: hypothetical protein BWY76_01751 [bacterium ADurb.Bin429]
MLIRHGYREGLTRAEHLALVPGTRERLAAVLEETSRQAYGLREASGPRGFTVLSRAMRAAHPGPVFAHAAAIEEVDPLVDTDSRLFVGLLP